MAGECDGCGWMGRYIKFSLSETQVHSRIQQLSHTVRDRMSRCQVGVITMAIEQLFSRTVNSCRLPQRKKAAWSQPCVARNKSHNWHTPCDSIWQIEVRFYFFQATLAFPFKIAIRLTFPSRSESDLKRLAIGLRAGNLQSEVNQFSEVNAVYRSLLQTSDASRLSNLRGDDGACLRVMQSCPKHGMVGDCTRLW